MVLRQAQGKQKSLLASLRMNTNGPSPSSGQTKIITRFAAYEHEWSFAKLRTNKNHYSLRCV
jgi:hypothetical protein